MVEFKQGDDKIGARVERGGKVVQSPARWDATPTPMMDLKKPRGQGGVGGQKGPKSQELHRLTAVLT